MMVHLNLIKKSLAKTNIFSHQMMDSMVNHGGYGHTGMQGPMDVPMDIGDGMAFEPSGPGPMQQGGNPQAQQGQQGPGMGQGQMGNW